MAIETPPYAPLGITTDTRWGAARWRRMAVICALCALVAAGVLIAERAHRLWKANSAAGSTPAGAPVNTARVPVPSEAPMASEAAVVTTAAPLSPIRPAVTEFATIPDSVPEPPAPTTVLRGAGIKPR